MIQYDKEEIDKLYTQSQQRQQQLNTAMEQLEVEMSLNLSHKVAEIQN